MSGLWERLLCLGCRTGCCVWIVGVWVVGQPVVSGLWDRLLCLGCRQAVVSGL